MIVAADGYLEGSYRVESPAGEWLGEWYCPQGLSRDVLLFGEELASGTSSHEVPGIGQRRGPVKA